MTEQEPLTSTELDALDAWWRAANYLSAGQIYLVGNPLLAEPLRPGPGGRGQGRLPERAAPFYAWVRWFPHGRVPGHEAGH